MATGRLEQNRNGVLAPETLRMLRIITGIASLGISEILIRSTQCVTKGIRRGNRA